MLRHLCECHELRSVKIVGCEILRCETMSLQNYMWYAIMEETTWSGLGSGDGFERLC